jgi:hypothetical protein
MVWRSLVLISCLSFGCQSSKWRTLGQIIDTELFERIGGTLLLDSAQISLRAIHLEQGSIEGRLIVTDGIIRDRGKSDTHLIIDDETTRLLVVTTKIDNDSMERLAAVGQWVRILGTVDRGRKGMPVMTALALSDRRSGAAKPKSGH